MFRVRLLPIFTALCSILKALLRVFQAKKKECLITGGHIFVPVFILDGGNRALFADIVPIAGFSTNLDHARVVPIKPMAVLQIFLGVFLVVFQAFSHDNFPKLINRWHWFPLLFAFLPPFLDICLAVGAMLVEDSANQVPILLLERLVNGMLLGWIFLDKLVNFLRSICHKFADLGNMLTTANKFGGRPNIVLYHVFHCSLERLVLGGVDSATVLLGFCSPATGG